MNVILISLIILDISLLAISSYFSLSPLYDIEFGLQGALIQGKYTSYSIIQENCEFKIYCEFIQNFNKSGVILQSLLILDIFTLSSVIVLNFLLTITLKNVINTKEAMSKCKKCILQSLAFGKKILFLHPILMNLGFVLWIIYSKVSELSKVITLHEGMIILIIQCFLSLLTIAYYIWINSSITRRNMRLLKSTSYKRDDLSISI